MTNLSFSKQTSFPETYVPGRVYFTGGGIYVATSETTLERYSVANVEDIENRIALLESAQTNKTLILRAYLFGVTGDYTKDGLEALLHTTLESLIASMKVGSLIVLFSTDDVSCNISTIIESNYTLTTEGELNTMTLMWHQYQLWNTLTITNNNGTYTLINTTE